MNLPADFRFPPAPADSPPQAGTEAGDRLALVAGLVDYLLQVLGSPRLKVETAPEELQGVKNLEELNTLAWAIRKMALSLSKGDLEYATDARGVVIGGLKAMQSNLKHLTWQAKQIAGGDYSHKVDFIGEFSEAFNLMTSQLSNRIMRLVDISEEYKDKSFKDALTGIYNRSAFMHYAQDVLCNVKEGDASSLIITDIDKFKLFNDVHGHLCGDEVLKAFAARLSGSMRPSDICSRYGGEEFLMLLPGTALAVAMLIAERLRSGVEAMEINFEGKLLKITASFGVAEIFRKPDHMSFETYIADGIRRADVNLYKAKEAGRNRVIG
ncbi:MAG: GGDEF domain-containing protein [Desulfovibrio sp.]|jgi:diguanylate cyclase (GGDEF)-like protein|nr:GGDEF domain-containing protein [Desulfovibrio sp.]